jgi:dienelactone hydrolase
MANPYLGDVTRRQATIQLGLAALGFALTTRGPEASEQCGPPPPAGFESFCFIDQNGISHPVYAVGRKGPAVLLLHELPGLVDADLHTARRLASAGYRVFAPLFFGKPGGSGHTLRYARQVCGPEQFACSKAEVTSPHVVWLLGLCDHIRTLVSEGSGIGVVGMCLTGMFPVALLRSAHVVAPVLCQPTIPFSIWTRFGWFAKKRALGLHPSDLLAAKARADVPLLGIRYRGDWRCRKERFDRLTEEFGARFFRLDLEGRQHSTLGDDFCPEAFTEVLAFLNDRLRESPLQQIPKFPLFSKANVKKEHAGPECCVQGERHRSPG